MPFDQREAAVELSVVIQPAGDRGFRAASGEPLPAAADGATRAEALGNLRAALEAKVRGGAEVVRLRLDPGPALEPGPPVWPDDDLTRDWLAGIADARRAADAGPDPADPGAGP